MRKRSQRSSILRLRCGVDVVQWKAEGPGEITGSAPRFRPLARLEVTISHASGWLTLTVNLRFIGMAFC